MEKRVQDYTQDILAVIRSNTSPAAMSSKLEDFHANDLADAMPRLTVQERYKLYRILDINMLSDIFEYTDSDNAAEYVKDLKTETDSDEKVQNIVLNPVEGVRYTVPSTINPAHLDESLTVRFRVGGVYKNCYVSAYFDEERVIHKKRPVVAPGEMEQIKLTKEQLMKYPNLKTITVKIEEA